MRRPNLDIIVSEGFCKVMFKLRSLLERIDLKVIHMSITEAWERMRLSKESIKK